MGVSENVVYPIVPNGFADHDPVLKNGYISLGILTQHFQVETHMLTPLVCPASLDLSKKTQDAAASGGDEFGPQGPRAPDVMVGT